jgi:hypothetical protein
MQSANEYKNNPQEKEETEEGRSENIKTQWMDLNAICF